MKSKGSDDPQGRRLLERKAATYERLYREASDYLTGVGIPVLDREGRLMSLPQRIEQALFRVYHATRGEPG
jgi:hypothetical protein